MKFVSRLSVCKADFSFEEIEAGLQWMIENEFDLEQHKKDWVLI